MERKQARNVYLWLWLSPFLTIPTLIFIYASIPTYRLTRQLCGGYSSKCFADIDRLAMFSAVLISGIWHLVLLVYLFRHKHPFVRGHAAQGLFLAGVRTLLAVIAVVVSFDSDFYSAAFVLLIMLLVWFFGNTIGMNQVRDGRCTLLKLRGVTFTLTPLPPTESEIRQRVSILRFSTNPRKRANAIEKLNQWGAVEHTQPVETFD